MIETMRAVRYTVGDLALAEQWYSRLLDVQPYQRNNASLRYCVEGSWLELVQTADSTPGGVLVYWGVDNLAGELLRLQDVGIRPETPPALADTTTRSATFLDPFGQAVGLIEIHDPQAQRARAHRAAEKIALRKVREALDEMGQEERQQRKAQMLVLALVLAGLVVGAIALTGLLPGKPQESRIVIPILDKK